jgi:poly(A) polymerase
MADSPTAYDDALFVLTRLREAGHEAYLAGGCVRDFLLGQRAKDFDVATSAEPNQVRGLFRNTQAVGAAFGVILVHHGDSTIEVATFRTDLQYRDGRRPEGVKFATAAEDAQRRDFTINGLFRDPIEDRIIDYVGGQADLRAKLLRAIGNADERFAEDHLRLLRAVRFASRLGFTIEPATAGAIAAHAHELVRISPERIAEELRKMLMPVTRDSALVMLEEFGLLRILLRFLPEKPALSKNPTPASEVLRRAGSDGHQSVSLEYLRARRLGGTGSAAAAPDTPLLIACGNGAGFSLGLALAAICLDFRMSASGRFDPRVWLVPSEIKRAVHAMRQALKISNDEADEMTGALAWGQLLADAYPPVAMLKRFLQQPYSADARVLMAGVARLGLATERINAVMAALEPLSRTEFAPPPLVTGDDLTNAGAVPGPKFRKALDAAYDAQLEGTISTREEAMRIAMGLAI